MKVTLYKSEKPKTYTTNGNGRNVLGLFSVERDEEKIIDIETSATSLIHIGGFFTNQKEFLAKLSVLGLEEQINPETDTVKAFTGSYGVANQEEQPFTGSSADQEIEFRVYRRGK